MQSEGFLTGRPLAAPGRLSGLWESTQGFRHGDGPDKYLRQREHRKRLFTVHWVGQTTSGSKDPGLRPVRRRPPLGPGPGGRRLFHAKGKGSEMRSRSCGETLSPQGSFLWEGAGRPRSLRGAGGRAPLAPLRPALATPQGGGGGSSLNSAPASLSHAPRGVRVQGARRPQGTGRLSVPKATATGRPRSCSPTGSAPAHSGSAAAFSHLCFTRVPSSGPWPLSPPASCPPGACCHPGSLHQACAFLLPVPRHRPQPES